MKTYDLNNNPYGYSIIRNGGPRHEQQGGKYQCPMKCEGNKTYALPGNCPVCHMKLITVGEGIIID